MDVLSYVLTLRITGFSLVMITWLAADPWFPRWGRQPRRAANLLFVHNCPENCMKTNEFGLAGAGIPLVSANSDTITYHFWGTIFYGGKHSELDPGFSRGRQLQKCTWSNWSNYILVIIGTTFFLQNVITPHIFVPLRFPEIHSKKILIEVQQRHHMSF